MKGLIVVHTENNYLEPVLGNLQSEVSKKELAHIFDDISKEMFRYHVTGCPVLYLEGAEGAIKRNEVYSPIKEQLWHSHTIPMKDSFFGQFLKSKQVAIDSGMTSVDIVGVAYGTCVTNVCDIFNDNVTNPCDRLSCERASYDLGWDSKKLENILSYNMPARIREELTDKPISLIS